MSPVVGAADSGTTEGMQPSAPFNFCFSWMRRRRHAGSMSRSTGNAEVTGRPLLTKLLDGQDAPTLWIAPPALPSECGLRARVAAATRCMQHPRQVGKTSGGHLAASGADLFLKWQSPEATDLRAPAPSGMIATSGLPLRDERS